MPAIGGGCCKREPSPAACSELKVACMRASAMSSATFSSRALLLILHQQKRSSGSFGNRHPASTAPGGLCWPP
eukprot:8265533-Alexandrium_andersonii.AAC.1